ncbi:MAG: MBL fold metallo-hydrolase [Gemmatimonadota bacterium]|nr:MBL fold metallo-hydrolase [Gemmatimonadota bacterium]MDH5804900.1 MBL fold metallo-hydrolase [Gemmatimonadota bacterium]
MSHFRVMMVLVALSVAWVGGVVAQTDWDAVEIETIHIAGNVYMLVGSGGNIGVLVGEDGPIVIDDQYAPLTEKIRAAVQSIDSAEVRFVINTHWHGDHTGGNENFSEAGALILAHDNVYNRMSVDQFMEAFNREVPAAPEEALPVITFSHEVTLRFNGEDLNVFHVENAHTDGDAIVHFTKANVFHMGDTFFNGRYPFIDVGSNGGINGVIGAASAVLEKVNSETKIIPGHGPLASASDLVLYRDMLVAVRDRIQAMMDEGMSEDEVLASNPTSEFDETFGNNSERFVRFSYQSLAGARER